MCDGLRASLARDVRVQHPAAPRCADDQAENTMSTNRRAVLYSAIAWVMAASAQLPAQAQPTDAETDAQVHTLQAVTIKAERKPEQAQAEQALQTVAGNTALVDNEQVERGRAASAEDVLAFQPGVFAQSTSGNAAAKISIRGSGLNTFYGGYVLGTKFLFDGLPITGPGGTQEDLLSIAGVNYTEVLYGANAFQYAATSLGGAINFVTHTGDLTGNISAGRGGELRLSQAADQQRRCGREFRLVRVAAAQQPRRLPGPYRHQRPRAGRQSWVSLRPAPGYAPAAALPRRRVDQRRHADPGADQQRLACQPGPLWPQERRHHAGG
ncbi:TonB-dependent Receptor Plug domain protein [Xanthomonas citri pv. mangiferaeindicae LMG 941]|nr:TonB-dependent Receptor Plug domain protein [Xanthomonas citri pv. mangiferaeindicae LMG 941]